jgi:hypothetical protein
LPAGEIGADLSKPPDGRLTAVSGCRPGQPLISSPTADEADYHPCLVAPANPCVAGPTCVDREIEQQPAEETEPDNAEPDTKNKHGGLREKI